MTGDVPGYWKHEVSGVLRPVISAYLIGEAMSPRQIAAMRAYLRQWVNADVWRGPLLDVLRSQVEEITTRGDIDRWLERAESMGMDPL